MLSMFPLWPLDVARHKRWDTSGLLVIISTSNSWLKRSRFSRRVFLSWYCSWSFWISSVRVLRSVLSFLIVFASSRIFCLCFSLFFLASSLSPLKARPSSSISSRSISLWSASDCNVVSSAIAFFSSSSYVFCHFEAAIWRLTSPWCKTQIRRWSCFASSRSLESEEESTPVIATPRMSTSIDSRSIS